LDFKYQDNEFFNRFPGRVKKVPLGGFRGLKNKRGLLQEPPSMLLIARLCGMNCLNRANVCTCTAVSANIRIDLINVAL
jgi:hypothetical protein